MSSTASFPLPQRRESAIFSDAETTKAIASSNSGSMCLSFILSLSLLTITLYFQLVLYHFTPSSTLHSTTLNLSAKQDPLPELFTPMTSVPSTLPPPRPLPALSTTESFLCGGLAACTAVTVCNIPEVCKTRLQLQGELAKTSQKVYSSVFDVAKKTWTNEGIRGLQRGLGTAYVYQVLLNGSRLGFYEPIRRSMMSLIGRNPNDQLFAVAVAAGAGSGCIGAAAGNPLFLIKARMQAYSPALPVGAQHYYKNSFEALSTIWKAEGPRGMVRGIDAAILRTGMGSSVQLPSYFFTKSFLVDNGYLSATSPWTYLASSSVSGMVVLVMQPADTALTRVYNQPTEKLANGRTRGLLYKNPIDCIWKTAQAEGFMGLYKGSTAHFLRIAPHTVITLVANELIMGQYQKYKASKLDMDV
ncbi:mitochondrial carrier domain-containing protein [Mrakia frigida]|uniref:Oac1p n=1 Tax=Mrakia frigida TaxID=29902 RepID=UPI003FCBF02C